MVWVEEIEICTAVNKEKKAQQYLLRTALYMRGKKGLTDVNLYSHAHMVNVFSVRLIWNTDSFRCPGSKGCPGSKEGMNLRERLKQFGLVNYSVWIKKERMKKQSNSNKQKKVRH
jgi:hypothetical protein